MARLFVLLLATFVFIGCPNNEEETFPDAATQRDATGPDAISPPDVVIPDAGENRDAEPGDAIEEDAEPGDAGAVCGNGISEGDEVCDLGAMNTDVPCVVAAHELFCSYCDTSCSLQSVRGAARVEGQVVSYNQEEFGVIPGALVALTDLTAVTATIADLRGRFVIPAAPANDRFGILAAVLPGDPFDPFAFGTGHVITYAGHEDTVTLALPLLEGCASVIEVTAGSPARAFVPEICVQPFSYAYADVRFAPDTVETPAANIFQGQMRVEIIPIPREPVGKGSTNYHWYNALPGDGSLSTANNTIIKFESLGAVQFSMRNILTADLLDIAPGQTARIQFLATSFVSVGDVVPLARYDFLDGVWYEAGTATATISETLEYVWEAEVPSPGWWTAYQPRNTGGCLRGHIALEDNTPVPYSIVRGQGYNYAVTSQSAADEDGNFCIDTPAEEFFEMTANYVPSSDPRRWKAAGFTNASGAGSCATSRALCVDTGTIAIAPINPSCVIPTLYWIDPNSGSREPYSGDFEVEMELPFITPDMRESGRRERAFLGTFTSRITGNACLQLPEADVFHFTTLLDGPAGVPCTVQVGSIVGFLSNNGVCGINETDCEALGEVDFYCGS
jgi:hypothetical protein